MITTEKAKQLRAVIERAVVALDLDNAAALDCAELFPRWEVGKVYAAGERVQYDGKLYSCIGAHTSQGEWTPAAAVSLWDEVKIDKATGYDEWQRPAGAHDAYNIGDRVVYNGVVYESTINGNVYSPEEYPAGWRRIDA